MVGGYAYPPNFWPPLAAALLLAAVGLYSWHRRAVPGARWLSIGSLLGVLWLAVIALQLASTDPATKILWRRFEAAIRLPAVTSTTCFVLDYAFPKRWLTRRSLKLLVVALLAYLLMVVVAGGRLLWQSVTIGADGSVAVSRTPLALILVVAGYSLVLVNVAAFVWLFVRSPQHRWPVSLMLFGELAGRALGLLDSAGQGSPGAVSPIVAGTLLVWTTYAAALFGFRIFDPLPAARHAVLEQMQAGVVVFDARRRVLNMNAAAESILGVRRDSSRGKMWQDLARSGAPLPALPDEITEGTGTAAEPAEMTLGSEADARYYAAALSPLKDFRGLVVGHLLVLRDVTEQRWAQTQILEQQRASAMLRERERLARELHDELGQVLGYVTVQARAARDQVDQDQKETAHDYLTQLMMVVQEAHADVRECILGAKLTSDPNFDFLLVLEQYLRRFTANHRIHAELVAPPELPSDAFDPVVQLQLFRIIQEALTNARKHASAQCVQVRFERAGGRAQVIIQDDGTGFDPQLDTADGGHFGLPFMRERAQEMDGSLTISSGPGQGTQVIVEVPLRE